jgi:hypothetical protein
MNTMEAKYTPGPWGWTYDGSSDYSIGTLADPQGDNRIAHVWDKNDERARANVNLIAAAPDLLAALYRMRCGNPLTPEAIDQADAAIAKATGNQ